MSQTVIYKGILVRPLDQNGDKILVQTTNAGDAQKAGLPFTELSGGMARFEAWVPESDLVAI